MEKGEPFFKVGGNADWCSHCESYWGMKISQKIKSGSAFWPSDPTSGNVSEETQSTHWKEHKHPCVCWSIIYYIITKIRKQPKCLSVDEWIKQLWDVYTMEYYSAITIEGNFILCYSMDGPRDTYAERNKPVRERQISYDFTYMWNLMNKLI